MRNLLLFFVIVLVIAGCKKSKPNPSYRVVVFGNSITYAPQTPSIGWNGNWGMAASALDSDYVHILTKRLKASDPANELVWKNIAVFENEFDTYDVDANLKTYRDFKPDLLIMRIGENVTRTGDAALYEKKYKELLDYFKAGNPNIKILAVGSAWPDREMSDVVLKKYSSYVSLAEMHPDPTYFAGGLFANPGVASHPSNKGMRFISDRIWEGAVLLIPDL
nr:SGNH/GDSL hydrolase family protein [uncultured Mucilaginibacter sp.]